MINITLLNSNSTAYFNCEICEFAPEIPKHFNDSETQKNYENMHLCMCIYI
jgi:hypothetical protein